MSSFVQLSIFKSFPARNCFNFEVKKDFQTGRVWTSKIAVTLATFSLGKNLTTIVDTLLQCPKSISASKKETLSRCAIDMWTKCNFYFEGNFHEFLKEAPLIYVNESILHISYAHCVVQYNHNSHQLEFPRASHDDFCFV